MSSKYLFVGEDLKLHEGEEAKRLLASTSDIEFLEDGKGVVRVPLSRWQLAQAYERRTWMDACSHAVDDRNEEHAEGFDGYAVLKGRSFPRAIELGCGPFTNIRVLSASMAIGSAVLLDPLINSYTTHRNCTYSHGVIKTGPTRLSEQLGRSWIGRGIRRVVRLLFPKSLETGVPVEKLIASPIEGMPDCGVFDLVVMINVIEHCYDVQAIFDKVLQLCRPGTVFVFHDRLYNADDVASESTTRFDAGHPLRVSGPLILDFLAENFSPLLEKQADIVDIVGDFDLTERGIYFIGERKQSR